MGCVRCGRIEAIESHHIVPKSEGGSDEPENKEDRCEACHDYKHAKMNIEATLRYEKNMGDVERIRVYEHRLEVLEQLNTPELIRERGIYQSYWGDTSTHELPRQTLSKREAKAMKQLELWVSAAQE